MEIFAAQGAPPVSSSKFAAGVVYTGGKFSTGVVLWRAVSVSLILVVHLDLRISPGIFEKI